jgi:general secretion pathway protein I
MSPNPVRGFTLIEILVALAVVSIALMAGMRATGSLTRMSERQGQQLLAQLCAENELAKVRLSKQLPGVGGSTVVCTQAGQTLGVAVDVLPTPNPNFRRVDVRVNSAEATDTTLLQVSTVVGRY